MRIGINALYMLPGQVGGSEVYLRGLLHGLSKIDSANRYFVFTNRENHDSLEIPGSNFTKMRCPVSAASRIRRVLYEQLVLPFLARKHAIDLLHSPGYVSPLLAPCKTVVTIADLQYVYYPRFLPALKFLYWRTMMPLSARRAACVLTFSENSRADIADFQKVADGKIVVTGLDSRFNMDHYAVEEDDAVLEKIDHGSRYIMCVSSSLPHKNIERLIGAYGRIAGRIGHKLVLVGASGACSERNNSFIERLGIGDRVVRTGYVSDGELKSLYRHADLFVLPSLFEGFGLPLVEAMNLGCPVAASDRTSISEVVGNAGVLFDPEDAESMGQAICRVVNDPDLRGKLVERGYERARDFSWETMAGLTLEAYRRACP